MLRVFGMGPKKYAVNAGFNLIHVLSQKGFAIYIYKFWNLDLNFLV